MAETNPSELLKARSLLGEMVNQHCQNPQANRSHQVVHSFLSTNEDAIDYLEEIGWLELAVSKTLCWVWTPEAFKEEE